MTASNPESVSNDALDSMNLGGDVAGGDAGDFTDFRRIRSFEIEQDDLPIDRTKSLDECEQPLYYFVPVHDGFHIIVGWEIVYLVEAQQLS